MPRLRIAALAVFSVATALTACQDNPAEVVTKVTDTSAAPRPLAARDEIRRRFTETGPATSVVPNTQNDLQIAASVVKLVSIEGQNAKLFGTGGGDPAINGLRTHIAFFAGSADGWVVYPIGDFLDFELLSATPGRLDLEVEESRLDEVSGTIDSARRRLIVRWTSGAEGLPPTAVTLTSAT